MTYPKLAQEVIDQLILGIREGFDFHSELGKALESLVKGLNVDRGLVWQVDGPQLTITHECSAKGQNPTLIGKSLDPEASTLVILNFISDFADPTDPGVVELDKSDQKAASWQPYLNTSPQFSSHLIVQLRSDIFSGFVAFQSIEKRKWSTEDNTIVAKFGALVSILIKDAYDLARFTMEAFALGVLVKVLTLFVEQAHPIPKSAVQAVNIVSESLGFKNSRLYLYDSGKLIAPAGDARELDLKNTDDPFVRAFTSVQGSFLGHDADASHRQVFGDEPGVVLPLRADDKPFGVFAMWERSDKESSFRPQDKELAFWFADELAKCIASASIHSSAR